MKCPFCHKEYNPVQDEKDKITLYYCSQCGALVAAYLSEMHDELKSLFSKYEIGSYKPKPPEWIRDGAPGEVQHG